MSGFIITVLMFLHLLSTAVWVGGIIFILLIAIPSSRQVPGSEAGRFMGELSKRFTPFANYSILLLAVTGILLGLINGRLSNPGSQYGLAIYLKSLIALLMITVHFYRGLILGPKIASTEAQAAKAALQKRSLNLVRLNMLLGVIILFLGGYLYAIRG